MKRWIKCEPDTKRTAILFDSGRAIQFQPCGVTSYHPEDARNRYCAYCGAFLEDMRA